MSEDFKIWWHNEGSGMPPFKEEETCDHVERVSAIAWSNGASKATLSLEADNARLKAEVERLTEELSNISGWGRGLESDLSHARVEISFLKAEVERLSAADSYLQSANEYSFEQRCDELEAEVDRLRASSFVTAVPVEQYERLRKAGDDVFCIACNAPSSEGRQKILKAWQAAKEGKQP